MVSCNLNIIIFHNSLYGFKMVKNLLVGVNITSPFQLVCFVSYLKSRNKFFDEIVLYVVNYWGRDKYMKIT